MSGTALQFKMLDGADRCYYGAETVRRTQRFVSRAAEVTSLSTSGESDGREDATAWKAVQGVAGRRAGLPCNLDRFLEATTPCVPAQYLSKTTRGWRPYDEESRAYFRLGDLWDSFNEWSAYGAGVPLVLNGRDSVVQYYVPYLSGIQLYADSCTCSCISYPLEDSDFDSFKDSSSDASSDLTSDSEIESGSKNAENCCRNCSLSHCMVGMNKPFLDEKHFCARGDLSSDDGDGGDSQGSLIFEYVEYDRPYCREPLADKIADLAKQFSVLTTIRSCDLLPTSWFSVAWYPIYRIPTGPTLRDLDACFLTFHCLSTTMTGTTCESATNKLHGADSVAKISLPAFGLASYKFKNSIWTSNDGCGWKLANILLEAADKWLQLLNANLPDYRFFASQNKFRR